MKAYHPGASHQCVQEESRIRKAHENFRRARDSGEIEQRQDSSRSVTAAGREDRVDFRVGEERLKLAGACGVGTRHDCRPIERMAGNLDAKAETLERCD